MTWLIALMCLVTGLLIGVAGTITWTRVEGSDTEQESGRLSFLIKGREAGLEWLQSGELNLIQKPPE